MMEVMLYETVISDSAVIKAALDTPTAATPTSKNAQQATMGESKRKQPQSSEPDRCARWLASNRVSEGRAKHRRNQVLQISWCPMLASLGLANVEDIRCWVPEVA